MKRNDKQIIEAARKRLFSMDISDIITSITIEVDIESADPCAVRFGCNPEGVLIPETLTYTDEDGKEWEFETTNNLKKWH